MSAVFQLLEQSADALAMHHDDAMTLQPAGTVVSGYAEELDMDHEGRGIGPAHLRLHIADELVTHAVHIRRAWLAGVALADVSTIEIAGTASKYRVRTYRDDPGHPEVMFFCSVIAA